MNQILEQMSKCLLRNRLAFTFSLSHISTQAVMILFISSCDFKFEFRLLSTLILNWLFLMYKVI